MKLKYLIGNHMQVKFTSSWDLQEKSAIREFKKNSKALQAMKEFVDRNASDASKEGRQNAETVENIEKALTFSQLYKTVNGFQKYIDNAFNKPPITLCCFWFFNKQAFFINQLGNFVNEFKDLITKKIIIERVLHLDVLREARKQRISDDSKEEQPSINKMIGNTLRLR